jgi:hypothetical protein
LNKSTNIYSCGISEASGTSIEMGAVIGNFSSFSKISSKLHTYQYVIHVNADNFILRSIDEYNRQRVSYQQDTVN